MTRKKIPFQILTQAANMKEVKTTCKSRTTQQAEEKTTSMLRTTNQ